MTNAHEQLNEAMNSLDEINERLNSQESAIKCQRDEMVKTEALIKQYQDWLKSQNDMLEKFISQKEAIETEKAKIVKTIQDYSNPTFNGTKNIVGSDTNVNSLIKPMKFDESYEITNSTRSQKYYREICDRLSEVAPHNEINYHNQTMIPNKLKASTVARRMVLYQIDNIGEYHLHQIIRQPIIMSIDIHVAAGTGELLSLRGEVHHEVYHVTQIMSCKSYFINRNQTFGTRFILLVNVAPMVLALDIHNPPEQSFEESILLSEEEGYTEIPPVTMTEYPDCFVKKIFTPQEMKDQLLFMDASFAKNVHDYIVPIALTVISYDGFMLLNTLMCPRTHIKDFCEAQHGLTENNIVGAPDIEGILRRFYRLIWNKVVVGHNLKEKFRYLKVEMKYLCGIRDLQSCYAIQNRIAPFKPKHRLPEIASQILRQSGKRGGISAEENAQTIRKVYLEVENDWKDSLTVRELFERAGCQDPTPSKTGSKGNAGSNKVIKEGKRAKFN